MLQSLSGCPFWILNIPYSSFLKFYLSFFITKNSFLRQLSLYCTICFVDKYLILLISISSCLWVPFASPYSYHYIPFKFLRHNFYSFSTRSTPSSIYTIFLAWNQVLVFYFAICWPPIVSAPPLIQSWIPYHLFSSWPSIVLLLDLPTYMTQFDHKFSSH